MKFFYRLFVFYLFFIFHISSYFADNSKETIFKKLEIRGNDTNYQRKKESFRSMVNLRNCRGRSKIHKLRDKLNIRKAYTRVDIRSKRPQLSVISTNLKSVYIINYEKTPMDNGVKNLLNNLQKNKKKI